MRAVRLVLIPVLAIIMAVAAGSAVYASNNASWSVSYNVATATSMVETTAPFNFGTVMPGVLTASTPNDLSISTNDPAGIQITASSATTAESGASPCVPDASRTVDGSSIVLTPTPVTNGTTATKGTASAPGNLGAPYNLFSAVPTEQGAYDEVMGAQIVAPANVKANSTGCSYTLPVNFVLVAQ